MDCGIPRECACRLAVLEFLQANQAEVLNHGGVSDNNHFPASERNVSLSLASLSSSYDGMRRGNEDLIKGKSIQSRHAGRDAAREMASRIGSTGEVESDFAFAHFDKHRVIGKSDDHDQRISPGNDLGKTEEECRNFKGKEFRGTESLGR